MRPTTRTARPDGATRRPRVGRGRVPPRPAVLRAAAILSLLLPAGLAAQVPETALGLGAPVRPIDARAAALGGAGVALQGGTFSLQNPADLVEFGAARIALTTAPEGVTVKSTNGSFKTGRSRFPLLRMVVPVGKWAGSLGFGSVLDQDWSLRIQDTLSIPEGRFPYEEQREQNGGISSVDVTLARRVGPLSFGAAYERLSGTLRQSFTRRFEADVNGSGRQLFADSSEAIWDYRSWGFRGGVGLDLGDRIRVGSSVEWIADLEASSDSLGRRRRFPMPVRLEGGVSARLTSRWLVTASGGWANWGQTGRVFRNGYRSRNVVHGEMGVEFGGTHLGPFLVPLRAGVRRARLPFYLAGEQPATETSATFGFGAIVPGSNAGLDLALEVGERGDVASSGFQESFHRLWVTFSLKQ